MDNTNLESNANDNFDMDFDDLDNLLQTTVQRNDQVHCEGCEG